MLKGKTAIVTGGSRGIGAAICKMFAQNGANIALLYAGNTQKAEETKAELLQMGVKAEAYQCNVADAEQVATVCKQIVTDFGSVDILVNNAGITKDKLVPMMKVPDFDSVVDTNLKGAFYMIKQVYPVMMKQRSGKIINISSVSGLMGNPGQANYSASNMTENLSENNQLKDFIPMKKFGTPQDVAKLALFLASDQSDYITGEVIRIDGGLAM